MSLGRMCKQGVGGQGVRYSPVLFWKVPGRLEPGSTFQQATPTTTSSPSAGGAKPLSGGMMALDLEASSVR